MYKVIKQLYFFFSLYWLIFKNNWKKNQIKQQQRARPSQISQLYNESNGNHHFAHQLPIQQQQQQPMLSNLSPNPNQNQNQNQNNQNQNSNPNQSNQNSTSKKGSKSSRTPKEKSTGIKNLNSSIFLSSINFFFFRSKRNKKSKN